MSRDESEGRSPALLASAPGHADEAPPGAGDGSAFETSIDEELPAARERWVASRAAELLFDRGTASYVASAAAVVITLGLLQSRIERSVLWSWASAMLVVFLLRYLLVRRFQSRDPATSEPAVWLRRHLAGVIVTGILWGGAGWFLFAGGSLLHQAYLIALLVGVTMAAVVVLPTQRGGFAIFGALALVPLVARLFLVHTLLHQLLAVLLLVLLLVLGVAATGLQRQARNSLELRWENRVLLRRLRATDRGLREEMQKRGTALRELQQREAVLERAERGRLDSERRFRLLAEHTRDLVCLLEPDARYLYVSPSCEEILGYRPEELVGKDRFELVAPEDRERVRRESHERVLAGRRSHVIAYRCRRASGEYLWLETVTQPVLDAAGEVLRLVTSSRDITERKRAEEQLFYEKELAQVTLQSIGEGVITTDAAGLIDYLNPVAETLTGWQLADAAGRPLDEVFHLVDEDEQRPVEDLVGKVLRGSDRLPLPERSSLAGAAGREVSVEATAAPIRDRAGRILGTVFVFRDVTKTRELAQQLSYQASHDALTGLINRRELESRLASSIDAGGPAPHDVLCYLDLDQFKVVNDTCGHVAGDEFLRRLGAFLRGRIRRSDSLARLGGDEFGILLHSCPLERAVNLAREVGRGVRDFRFEWQGRVFSVGVSIGVVEVTPELVAVADVLRAADTACYAAKDRGRNRVQVYQHDDHDLTRRQGEMQWLQRLHDALADDRLELWAQPILAPGEGGEGPAAESAAARRMEILVALREGGDEPVRPGTFIPVAERYNLMPAIDRWVIDNAFAALSGRWWREADEGPALCFINLSGTSLTDETFLAFVESRFEHYRVPPAGICFEITETAAIANLSEAIRFMGRLREIGVRFALDDFGSGLSSFAHLRSLPVDFLKIDGTFVRDIESDSVDYAMVEAINRIGHLLGLETIAEYVENEGILRRLEELAVDYVQGYAIGRPRLLEAVLAGGGGGGEAAADRSLDAVAREPESR